MSSINICAVLLCAGTGSRYNLNSNKVLQMFGNTTPLEHCINVFLECNITTVVVVSNKRDIDNINTILDKYKDTKINFFVCEGGDTRFYSVKNGLNELVDKNCDIVIIHDCARANVDANIIKNSINSAKLHGSGIASTKTIDTIAVANVFDSNFENEQRQKNITLKSYNCNDTNSNLYDEEHKTKEYVGFNSSIKTTLNRDTLRTIQTPQTFDYKKILHAYNNTVYNTNFTDDSSVWINAGFKAFLCDGSLNNIKITTPEDFWRIGLRQKIGVGFDVHRLEKNRKLVLGGVEIKHDKGLLGHSDADVLTHSIMDALLSALGLPDIGVFFPDTDDKYKNISSLKLLKIVENKLCEKNYSICNISSVIIAQEPKLQSFICKIEESLASALNLKKHQIKISTTTTEHLGIIGDGNAIAASTTVLLDKSY